MCLRRAGFLNAGYLLIADGADGAVNAHADAADARRLKKGSSRSAHCDPARTAPQGSDWIDAFGCSAYILKMLNLDALFNAADDRACNVSSASTPSQRKRHSSAREAAAVLAVALEGRTA